MFNRLALYFIFSPLRTHLSSFFSPFLPTRALTAWTLFHPFLISLSLEKMGLSFLHVWRGALDTGAPGGVTHGSHAVTRLWMFLKAKSDKHLNWNILMMPLYFQSEEEKVWVATRVAANHALMPPGCSVLSLTILHWAELSFRPSGNEVSGYFSSGRSPPYSLRSGDYVPAVSGRSAATPSKSFNFTPCSATSNPPIPQGASVNLCKVRPPPPTLICFAFLTSMAPLFPILPALTVSVWVFCRVKTLSRPSLSLSLAFTPAVFHTLSFCVSFQLFGASVWWAQAVESVS